MSDEPKGKDGLARNWARFKQEAKILRREMGPAWKRFKALESHAYTNLWVESFQLAAYLMGHIVGLILFPFTLALMILLAWKW